MIRRLARLCVVVAAVTVLTVVGFLSLVVVAGATTVATVPWTGSPTEPSGTVIGGECNEVWLARNADAGASDGFVIQVACQGVMPSGAVVESMNISLPCASVQEVQSNVWINHVYGVLWDLV